MDVELCHRFTSNVDVLDLLWGNVLALRQFEDVLFPINDLQRAILQDKKNASLKKTNGTSDSTY